MARFPRPRGSILPAFLLCLAVLASGAAARVVARPGDVAKPADLRTLTLYSRALHGTTPVRILLPDSYATGQRRYPVLYLLHGFDDSYLGWSTQTDLVSYVRRLPLIVVMPEGDNGWYTNSIVPRDPQWETYHIDELIPYIDSHYRTIATRDGRAIAGLSMGGMGAMAYAARHPDLFVAAAAFSGVLDLTMLKPFYALTPTLHVFGNPRRDAWRWSGHNPTELAPNLRGLRLFLASGNGQPGPFDTPGPFNDPVEGLVHVMLLHMVAALDRAHIAATVDDYGPGEHNYAYWQRDLHHALPVIMAAFAHPPALPAAWSYRGTDPSFDVWGYHVVRAGPPGWTVLSGVSRSGLTVGDGSPTGAVTVTLTTAALYRPGARYTITVSGGSAREVSANGAGRLRVQVRVAGSTGPRHLTISPD